MVRDIRKLDMGNRTVRKSEPRAIVVLGNGGHDFNRICLGQRGRRPAERLALADLAAMEALQGTRPKRIKALALLWKHCGLKEAFATILTCMAVKGVRQNAVSNNCKPKQGRLQLPNKAS